MLRPARIRLLALAAGCLCLILSSCHNGRNGSSALVKASSNAADSSRTLVSAADSGTAPGDFWRKFLDPARKFDKDTSLIAGVDPGSFAQFFEVYANQLENSDLKVALDAQDTCMALLSKFEKAHPGTKVRNALLYLNEHYFYYTESPYRCEDYYIPVIREELRRLGVSGSKSEDEMAERQRMQFRMDGCIMNRTGSPAKDITLSFPDGRTMRLHEIHSKYTLLIFSNPDCQACKDLLTEYREKVGFKTEIPPQQLAIVSVYPDSDLSVWKKHLKDYPPSWLVCRSSIPDRSAGYDLRAVPALYLLDKDKTVIMKDAPFDKILNYLNDQIK